MDVKTTVVTEEEIPHRLVPKFITNLFGAANELSEAALITCTGIKKATAGVDEIATLMLSQQHKRLKQEFDEA